MMPQLKTLWRDRIFLLTILLLALALRLDFLFASDFRIDADEGIVGLMGKHILETGRIPFFYYGQHYMGSLEAIAAALSFNFFGLSTISLKVVPLCFSLVLILLLYLLGLQVGDRRVSRLAALLTALPPSTLLIWSTKARGGFIEVLVIGALALLLTCSWLRAARPVYMGLFWTGVVLGVGWWVNNQIIYFMLPIGFAVLARLLHSGREKVLRGIGIAALAGFTGFFIGGLPYWVYNLQNNFVSFEMFGTPGGSGVLQHLGGLVETAIPILLGAKRYWQNRDLFFLSTLLLYTIYGGLLLLLLLIRGDKIRALFRFKIDRRQPLEMLLLFLLSTVCVFSFSSFGYLVQAPRYLLPAYVGIIVLTAYSVTAVRAVSRSGYRVLVVLVLGLNLLSYYPGKRVIPGEPFVFKQDRVSKDHAELIQWLKARRIGWVRTNYWIGYRLAFETGEDVRFLVYGEPGQVRIEGYEKEGRFFGKDKMPLVLVPAQGKILRKALRVQGYRFSRDSLSGYDVIYDIEPSQKELTTIPPEEFTVMASDSFETARLAVDGDESTRWGSGRPQAPGMEFSVVFKEPLLLRALEYELGNWRTDFPRNLSIEMELESGELESLFSVSEYGAIRYALQGDTGFKIFISCGPVKKVILRQNGSDSFFDWSIAELKLFK